MRLRCPDCSSGDVRIVMPVHLWPSLTDLPAECVECNHAFIVPDYDEEEGVRTVDFLPK